MNDLPRSRRPRGDAARAADALDRIDLGVLGERSRGPHGPRFADLTEITVGADHVRVERLRGE